MSYFEFLMVLVGVVGAIAISEILVYWGHAVRERAVLLRPGLFLTATAWMVVNLLSHITGIWAYRTVGFDATYQSFLVLLPVVVLALSVTVLVPSSRRTETVNLEAHYFAVASPALTLAALHELLALLADQLPGAQGVPPAWYMLALALLLGLLAVSHRRTLHIVGWGVLWLIVLGPAVLA